MGRTPAISGPATAMSNQCLALPGRPERRAEQQLFAMVRTTSPCLNPVGAKAAARRASAIIARPWLEVVLNGRLVTPSAAR